MCMNRLTPCPLCGSSLTALHSNGGCNNFTAKCHNCGITHSEGVKWGDEGRIEAIENWQNLNKFKR